MSDTLRWKAERLMELAMRISATFDEAEENRLCDERDRILSDFRKADAALSTRAGERERVTQQSWKVWVKVGVNGAADFIEDVTIYDRAEKPGYAQGTLTIDPILHSPSLDSASRPTRFTAQVCETCQHWHESADARCLISTSASPVAPMHTCPRWRLARELRAAAAQER